MLYSLYDSDTRDCRYSRQQAYFFYLARNGAASVTISVDSEAVKNAALEIAREKELFACPSLKPEDEQDIRDFLSFVTIVPLCLSMS
jgi:hypothetical protein